MRCFALIAFFLISSKLFALGNTELEQDFTRKKLQDVLAAYTQAGYKLIYTDKLILSDMVVHKDSQSGNAQSGNGIDRLRSILGQFNLQIEYNSLLNAWYIKQDKKPDAASEKKRNSSSVPTTAIEEVTVTASTYRINKIANANQSAVDPLLLEISPARGSDPIYIVNSLPGLTTSGISAKPHIRGGDQNEILFEFDGIELLDPYHLKDFQNLISGVNSSIVQSIDVYTGGFPAQYGGRMGGVIDLSTVDTPEDNYVLDANFLTTSLTTSGDMKNDKASWLVNFRRGNIEDAIERVSPEVGSPRFFDAYLNFDWKFNEKYSTELGYLHIQDNIQLNGLNGDTGESAQSHYLSQYYWLKLNTQYSPFKSSRWTITAIDIDNTRQGSINRPNDPDESTGNLYDKRDFSITRLEYSFYNKINSHSILQLGGRIEYNEGSYKYNAEAQLGELSTLLGKSPELHIESQANPEGASASVYTTYKFLPTSYFSIDAGIRYDQQNFYQDNQDQLSPRVSVQYSLTDKLNLKASVGRFHQHQYINDLDVVGGENTFSRSQKSDHYIVGMDYKGDVNGFSLEAYKKRILSPASRYQNVFNTYSLLPELAPDFIKNDIDHTNAEGAEFLYEHVSDKQFKYWFSYEISKVRDFIDGQQYYRQWGYSQMAKGGLLLTKGNWTLSATTIWHDGWRTTQFPGHVDTLDEEVDYKLNDQSLASYFTLDLRSSYTWLYSASRLQLYFECYNLTSHDNVGGYNLEINDDSSLGGYNIQRETELLLPLILNLGFTYSF